MTETSIKPPSSGITESGIAPVLSNSIPFEIGKTYTRDQISKLLHSNDSNIRNGVFKPKGEQIVIIFVTENKTRDRTPYKDQLVGDILSWEGQKSGRTDTTITHHSGLRLDLLLMYRLSRRERADYSFLYLGRLTYIEHRGAHPSSFQLRLLDYGNIPDPLDEREKIIYEEIKGEEGEERTHLVKRFKRNRKLRDAAISMLGATCSVCGFNFLDFYGNIGKGFVEVHHISPLSEVRGERVTDPSRDLAIVCSNCHSMLHKTKPVLTPDELRKRIKR